MAIHKEVEICRKTKCSVNCSRKQTGDSGHGTVERFLINKRRRYEEKRILPESRILENPRTF